MTPLEIEQAAMEFLRECGLMPDSLRPERNLDPHFPMNPQAVRGGTRDAWGRLVGYAQDERGRPVYYDDVSSAPPEVPDFPSRQKKNWLAHKGIEFANEEMNPDYENDKVSDSQALWTDIPNLFGENYYPYVKDRHGRPALETVARAAGAIPGSTVNFRSPHGDGSVEVISRHPDLFTRRRFWKDENNRLMVDNILQELLPTTESSALRGEGHERFEDTLKHLQHLGVNGIHIPEAAGANFNQGRKRWNGGVTWPTFGFQGELDESDFQKLPEHIQRMMGNRRDTHSLFDIPGKYKTGSEEDTKTRHHEKSGREAWKDINGTVKNMYFDLSPNSPHMQRWNKYLTERRAEEE